MKWTIGIGTLAAILAVAMLGLLPVACGDDDDDDDSADVGSGTLEFYTNGEDFILNGFTGKTGWDITFDHFYINLYGPTAYQVAEDTSSAGIEPAHAGHPHNDIPEGSAHAALTGDYWVDLHEAGTDETNLVLLDSVDDAVAGNYNYASFVVRHTETGDYAGYSLVMTGSATKGEETVDFTIKLLDEMIFSSCHQEVDDEYAGVVEDGGVGSIEMTFHSDHMFGDADTLDDPDGVNPGAVGFQPFADLATDGVLDIDQGEMADLMPTDDYTTFVAALRTIGHSGEGHCGYTEYTGDDDSDE